MALAEVPRTPLQVKLMTPRDDVTKSWNQVLIDWPGRHPETRLGRFTTALPHLVNRGGQIQ